MRPRCSAACIVSASSCVTECRITQRDATLVCLPPHTLLRSRGKWFFNLEGTDERIITGRVELIFTFICNNLKSHGTLGYLHPRSFSLTGLNVLKSPSIMKAGKTWDMWAARSVQWYWSSTNSSSLVLINFHSLLHFFFHPHFISTMCKYIHLW